MPVKKEKTEPSKSIREVLDRLLIRDQSLLVAVSGGADSVALLFLLEELRAEFGLALHVGHFDHQLRTSSNEEAEWVQLLCSNMEIGCTIGTPADCDHEMIHGSEEAARQHRYEFLNSLAGITNSRWVAVAHTQDDQVETVLHHIARGTGLKGLRGIPEVRPLSENVNIVRPLLEISREQLVKKLSDQNQTFLTDESNSDAKFTRNRIRHDVLPYLKKTLNPQIDSALIRLSQQANEAQQAIEEVARKILSDAIEDNVNGSVVRLKTEPFLRKPRAIVITAMTLLWEQHGWPRKNMSQHHWGQLAEILDENSKTSGLSCPGGIQVSLRRKALVFKREQ